MVLIPGGIWYQHMVDAEEAFLNGVFEYPEKHKLYVKISEAYQQWYPPSAIFLLLKPQYGTVQASLLKFVQRTSLDNERRITPG